MEIRIETVAQKSRRRRRRRSKLPFYLLNTLVHASITGGSIAIGYWWIQNVELRRAVFEYLGIL